MWIPNTLESRLLETLPTSLKVKDLLKFFSFRKLFMIETTRFNRSTDLFVPSYVRFGRYPELLFELLCFPLVRRFCLPSFGVLFTLRSTIPRCQFYYFQVVILFFCYSWTTTQRGIGWIYRRNPFSIFCRYQTFVSIHNGVLEPVMWKGQTFRHINIQL